MHIPHLQVCLLQIRLHGACHVYISMIHVCVGFSMNTNGPLNITKYHGNAYHYIKLHNNHCISTCIGIFVLNMFKPPQRRNNCTTTYFSCVGYSKTHNKINTKAHAFRYTRITYLYIEGFIVCTKITMFYRLYNPCPSTNSTRSGHNYRVLGGTCTG